MQIRRKSDPIGANVGTSSLLLVFVILCLVSFATLSIVSANADKKLNAKIVERTAAYYDACNKAEEKLQGIDATLKSLYDGGASRDEYFASAGDTIDFAITVSDVQTLNVSLKVNYPSDNDPYFYSIEKWELKSTGSLESSDEGFLPVLTFDD